MSGKDITKLKGVGPALATKLAKLGIESVEDLLTYFPRRYDDYSNLVTINKVRPGAITIKAKISQAKGRYVRGGLHITEAIASDQAGSLRLLWFNQPYRASSIKADQEYFISGNLELKRQKFSVMNPSTELVSDFPINTARIIPVYKQSKDIRSHALRKMIREAFDVIPDVKSYLPKTIEKKYKLINKKRALEQVHFPDSQEDVQEARRRLGFEEIFELMLANMLSRKDIEKQAALPIAFDETWAKKLANSLPFELTPAQKKTTWEIFQDITAAHPMNRLLEGDVGSGKTAVAFMAIGMCLRANLQAALLAPTEILAKQHAESLSSMLEVVGMGDNVCLLTGSMTKQQKTNAQAFIKKNKACLIVGTHALIQENVEMKRLALAIVDEQHRFGVEQRKKLLKKTGHMPHLLSMTATPIPRSLALTIYGDMDISLIKTKPKNRKPIKTELIRPASRKTLNNQLTKELHDKGQIFVVCPLIAEGGVVPAISVDKAYDMYQKEFKNHRVAKLHGKQVNEEKQRTMQEFVDGKIDILVATTVIEVGVDVPNATVMVIESPERFGLAQIHQLRGRVGRGEKQGYCYLVMSEDKAPTKRLRAVEQSTNGFRLAELDLEIRGPGAIYGTQQHGALDLRMVDITDVGLLKQAREAAQEYVNDPQKMLEYPELQTRVNQLQKIIHLN